MKLLYHIMLYNNLREKREKGEGKRLRTGALPPWKTTIISSSQLLNLSSLSLFSISFIFISNQHTHWDLYIFISLCFVYNVDWITTLSSAQNINQYRITVLCVVCVCAASLDFLVSLLLLLILVFFSHFFFWWCNREKCSHF